MRKGNTVEILRQHLKTSAWKLKLGCTWAFQMDTETKLAAKIVKKCLEDIKVNVLEWPSQKP